MTSHCLILINVLSEAKNKGVQVLVCYVEMCLGVIHGCAMLHIHNFTLVRVFLIHM